MIALLTGIVAGIIHVLSGPDHLAAVSPLAANAPARGWKIGLSWGLGHTGGVWVVAVVAILFKEILPLQSLSRWSEFMVGFVLIAVGLWTLRKAVRLRLHHHTHSHNGLDHTHYHLHADPTSHDRATAHAHSHAPAGIGLLHGLAGSSHLVGVLPALLLPTVRATAFYVVGYGLGSIVAMASFGWIVGQVIHRLLARYARAYNYVLVFFALAAIGVGVFWLTTGLPGP